MSTIVYAIERVQTHAPAIREALRGKVPRDWDAHSAGKYRDPYDIFISGRAQLPAQETTQRSV
jgi:hypothetical protein